jgi:hypothetical protein
MDLRGIGLRPGKQQEQERSMWALFLKHMIEEILLETMQGSEES